MTNIVHAKFSILLSFRSHNLYQSKWLSQRRQRSSISGEDEVSQFCTLCENANQSSYYEHQYKNPQKTENRTTTRSCSASPKGIRVSMQSRYLSIHLHYGIAHNNQVMVSAQLYIGQEMENGVKKHRGCLSHNYVKLCYVQKNGRNFRSSCQTKKDSFKTLHFLLSVYCRVFKKIRHQTGGIQQQERSAGWGGIKTDERDGNMMKGHVHM